MDARLVILALAVGLAAVVIVAAPAAADEGVACTMSMPPECKGAVGVVVCTMSMPPECRAG
ncbi:MAG TPA: hypothetical protein VNX21_05370 [Candidatus Thermoplasmatota archaeon]|nr:hypothetical protein [Candidatus Thermoplasmatota archaeon]